MRNLNPKHVQLVAKREYLEIVRNKWFVIMTILTPFLMIAWSVVPSMMMMKKTSAKRTMVIVASDESLAKRVAAALEETPPPTSAGRRQESIDIAYTLVASADTSDEHRAALQQQIDARAIDGFLWLDAKSVAERNVIYTARFTNDIAEMNKIQAAVRDVIRGETFRSYGINDDQVKAALKPVDFEAIQWENGQAKRSNFLTQLFTLLVLGLTMFLTVMLYGISVMRAVLEEKTNRVMEVLMSSLTSTELMVGKILGVGGAGLTQLAAWTVMASVVASLGFFASGADFGSLNLGPAAAIFFGVYFLLGFFLYATLSAAIGSMVSSEREAQQIQQFVMMPLGISFAFMFFAMRAPNDPMITVMSLIPFFSPMLMYMRIVVQTPPAWQIALSIVLMLGTIALLFFIAGRIYRVGVLMYGKRATLPEIIRWIRYA
jgi:ABC-2 type transport system permease protein